MPQQIAIKTPIKRFPDLFGQKTYFADMKSGLEPVRPTFEGALSFADRIRGGPKSYKLDKRDGGV